MLNHRTPPLPADYHSNYRFSQPIRGTIAVTYTHATHEGIREITMETRLGTITGTEMQGIEAYLGVPYAQPPVAENRWQPPKPIEPWQSLDATRHGNRCLQTPYHEVLSGLKLYGEESEDCLYMNIYTPGAEGKRPVMVWIHGGAYIQGSANEYDGATLAAENDVVVVAINYRLGIFGFLDLSRFGDTYAGSAMLGIQDQIAALRWVNENIADYGGDPDCVTIFGESAGGGSVLSLLSAPAAKGLFHRAAALSPGEVLNPPIDNIAPLAAHAGVDPDELLPHLQSLSGEELKALQVNGIYNAGISIDGAVVTQRTSEALRKGSSVPLVIGSCRDEGTLFAPIIPAEFAEMTAFGLAITAGNGDPNHYLSRRDVIMADAEPAQRIEKTWTDMFRGSVLRCGQAATEGGGGGWVYNFDIPTDHPLGITHASDIPFVFNQLISGGLAFHDTNSPDNQRLAQLWSSTLARFARSGNPNGGDLPSWPAYDTNTRACLIIDLDPHIEEDPDGPDWRDAYGMEF
jgi:para-nitrobenzyl esterase